MPLQGFHRQNEGERIRHGHRTWFRLGNPVTQASSSVRTADPCIGGQSEGCRHATRIALNARSAELYPVHLRTRKSSGDMMRKLSVTLSQNVFHVLGTSFRKKPSTASQKPLYVA